MNYLPKNIQKTIEEFSKLPGIGAKSAERLTFYLLRKRDSDIKFFGQTVSQLKEGVQYCNICCNLTVDVTCGICQNPNRDATTICIVEEMLDLIAIEKSNEYKGTYHVLHGVISPVDGIGPDELKIAELVQRVKESAPTEIILALNPSIEGEATSAYIIRTLNNPNIKITRLARGIPIGGDLEYADSQTLRQALSGRSEY